MHNSRPLYAVLVAVAALLAGCGDATPPSTQEAATSQVIDPEVVVLGEGTPIVTIESMETIVTWGSHLLRVEAIDESERNSSPLGPGEEMIGRDVTVRVDEVLWSHPEAVSEITPGQHLPVYTFPGYLRTDGDTVPAVEDGQLRMELGEQYVIAMADDTNLEGGQILTLLTTLAPDSDVITLPDGSDLRFGTAKRELTAAADAAPPHVGPRPGESLVERLERSTDAP
jgi:hypothetical protein